MKIYIRETKYLSPALSLRTFLDMYSEKIRKYPQIILLLEIKKYYLYYKYTENRFLKSCFSINSL